MNAVALYLRLSSEDAAAHESDSIQSQRVMLHEYLRNNPEFSGLPVLEFCDDGYSGSSFNRPGVKRMLELAGNTVGVIVVKDFSRFGRNLVEVGDYLDQVFPFLGVRFISVADSYDSANSIGSSVSLDVSMKAMIHEMYSRETSEKIRCTQLLKQQRGEAICGLAIYGYKKSKTERNRLVVDESAARVVRRIFEMAGDGMKQTQIAVALNRESVPSPLLYRRQNGEADQRGWRADIPHIWTRNIVKKILADERYIGNMVSRKTVRHGVCAKPQEVHREDWIIVKNTHEAIVPEELFQRVAARFRRHGNHPATRQSLFSGLLKCRACNRNLKREARKERSYYYCFGGKHQPGAPCAELRLYEDDLERAALTALHQQIRLLPQEDGKPRPDAGEDLSARIAECESAIKKCRAAQIALFESFSDGGIGQDVFISRKREIAERLTAQKEQLAELHRRLAASRQEDSAEQRPHDLGRYAFAERLTRDMLMELVQEIQVGVDGSLEICWTFSDGL